MTYRYGNTLYQTLGDLLDAVHLPLPREEIEIPAVSSHQSRGTSWRGRGMPARFRNANYTAHAAAYELATKA